MTDFDEADECFDELKDLTIDALRGACNSELLAEAKRLICCDTKSPVLHRFTEMILEKVERLRRDDSVVKAYFGGVTGQKETQQKKRLSEVHDRRKKAKTVEALDEGMDLLPPPDVETVDSNEESPRSPDPMRLSKKSKADLREAKDKMIHRMWAMLLGEGAKDEAIQTKLNPNGEKTSEDVKRLLELHAFSFDLQSSLKSYQKDSMQRVRKQKFISMLQHCIVMSSMKSFHVIPDSMLAMLTASVDASKAVKKDPRVPVLSKESRSFAEAWIAFKARSLSCPGPSEDLKGVLWRQSFTVAWKAFVVLLNGSGKPQPVEKDPRKAFIKPRKTSPSRVRTRLDDELIKTAPGDVSKELLLDCITLKSLDGFPRCATFLDHFFEIPQLHKLYSKKPQENEKLRKAAMRKFEVRKDAFLEKVASVHKKRGTDLRAELSAKLEEMHLDRQKDGPKLQWSPLCDMAVDVMLEVLDAEWNSARISAEAKDAFGGKQQEGAFVLKSDHPYAIDLFGRAVRAFELRSCDSRGAGDLLKNPSRLTQDLRHLMKFADGCVARALVFEGVDKATKAVYLEKIWVEFDNFPMFRDRHDQIREALYALRSFCRIALRRRIPEEDAYVEGLKRLESFEDVLYTPVPPRYHFASRIPMLLLGKIWPQLYNKLKERRPELTGRSKKEGEDDKKEGEEDEEGEEEEEV